MKYTNFLQKILKNASHIANDKFGNVSSSTKPEDNNQVLTEADLEIGKYLVSEVQNEFPTFNVIDEEAGVVDKSSDFTWVIDPIDGTSNFANGLPTYGIMVGLVFQDKPIAGAISLPFFNDIYYAEQGQGAYKNGTKIFVSKEQSLLKSLACYQIDGHQEDPQITFEEGKILSELILNIRNLRTSNSAFDICQVAEGKYGVIANKTSKIWDNVAQQPIIEEAGGVYTDFFGKQMDYSNPLSKAKENFTYSAGSGILHKQLLSIINK